MAALLPAAAAEAKRGACVVGEPGPGCDVWTGKVRSVNDGDTIDVDVAGDGTTRARRIRFAGVQAMEQTAYCSRHRQGDCHAVEATQRLEQLVERARGRVRLAAEDPQSMSRSRFVRTVAVRLRRPLARRRHDDAARRARAVVGLLGRVGAERELQRARRSRRSPPSAGCSTPTPAASGPSAASPLKLLVNWDADGDDTANPSGEWVKIRNLDPVNAVPLGGWYLRDSGLRRYTFPAGAAIPPGGTVTLDVGRDGDDVARDVSAGACAARCSRTRRTTRTRWATARTCSTRSATSARDALPVPRRLHGSAAGRGRPQRRPARPARVGHAHQPHRRPVDLDGLRAQEPAAELPLRRRLGAAAGRLDADPGRRRAEDDTALDKHWGFAKPILRDAGDVVALRTYTDITLACTAWGDRSC